MVVANNIQPSPLATVSVNKGNLIVTPIDPNGGELRIDWQITDYQGTLLIEGTRNFIILKEKKMNSIYLGKRGTAFLFAEDFGGLNFVVERESLSPSPDLFFPRGSNILQNSEVVLSTNNIPPIVSSVTGFGGLVMPTSFPSELAGYVRGMKADGAVFFTASSIIPPPPPVSGLIDGETIGTVDGFAIKSIKIGNGFFVCQVKTTNPFAYFPRGNNFLTNSAFVQFKPVVMSQFAGGDTSYGGRTTPANLIAPSGYVEKTTSDGAVYFEAMDIIPPGPPQTGEFLIDGEVVGLRNNAKIKTIKLGGSFYLCEVKESMTDAFFVRGRNLLYNPSTTFSRVVDFFQLAGEDTGFGGLSKPSGVKPPSGYVEKTTADGALYFEATVIIPPIVIGALIDGEVVGSRNGNVIKTFNLGGKFYLCEVKSVSPEAFFVRGKNLLTNSGVTFTKKIMTDQLGGEDTGFGGLSKPSGVTTPLGFVEKTTSDGAVYFEKGTVVNPRALVSGEVVGTRKLSDTSSKNLTTKLYGNDFYILEERTSSPESFFVRGKNIVGNSTVTLSKAVDISLLAGDNTAFDGTALPPSFVTPSGYTKKTETDGAVYFEKDTVVITPDPAPSVTPPVLPIFTQLTDTPVKEDSFLKKNLMWIIPVAIVGAIAIGIGIYRLLKV